MSEFFFCAYENSKAVDAVSVECLESVLYGFCQEYGEEMAAQGVRLFSQSDMPFPVRLLVRQVGVNTRNYTDEWVQRYKDFEETAIQAPDAFERQYPDVAPTFLCEVVLPKKRETVARYRRAADGSLFCQKTSGNPTNYEECVAREGEGIEKDIEEMEALIRDVETRRQKFIDSGRPESLPEGFWQMSEWKKIFSSINCLNTEHEKQREVAIESLEAVGVENIELTPFQIFVLKKLPASDKKCEELSTDYRIVAKKLTKRGLAQETARMDTITREPRFSYRRSIAGEVYLENLENNKSAVSVDTAPIIPALETQAQENPHVEPVQTPTMELPAIDAPAAVNPVETNAASVGAKKPKSTRKREIPDTEVILQTLVLYSDGCTAWVKTADVKHVTDAALRNARVAESNREKDGVIYGVDRQGRVYCKPGKDYYYYKETMNIKSQKYRDFYARLRNMKAKKKKS